MTDQWGPNPQPTEPQPPRPNPTPPERQGWPSPSPKRKRRIPVLGWIGIGLAVLITLVVIGSVAGGSGTKTTQPGQHPAAISTATTAVADTMPVEPAATLPAKPKASDFELTVKTLSKQCFGSAGCNIVFRIEVAYGGPTLDPATTWEVTYEVRGPEDGTQTNTLTVTGTQSSVDQEEFASTRSSSVKLKAVVTDVSEQ